MHHHHSHSHHDQIIAQVADWLKQEKTKRATRGVRASKKKNASIKIEHGTSTTQIIPDTLENEPLSHTEGYTQTPSELSDESVDLDQLERILAGIDLRSASSSTPKTDVKDSYFPHHSLSSSKMLRKSSTGASSDREQADDDALAPSAEVVLDNSKTLAYPSSAAASTVSLRETSRRVAKEKEAWLRFKSEILRLAHTLKLKGWRRVPLDHGGEIDVQRLSGALTNAVYVVSPPSNLPRTVMSSHSGRVPSAPRPVAPPP